MHRNIMTKNHFSQNVHDSVFYLRVSNTYLTYYSIHVHFQRHPVIKYKFIFR